MMKIVILKFEFSLSITELLNKEVKIEPAILLMLIRVERLNVHLLTHTDPLVEENDLLFRCQSLKRIRDLDVDLKLDDLTELTNRYIV